MPNDRPEASNPLDIISTFEDIQQGVGNWVANGTPSSPIGQAIQGRYRDACDSWSNGLNWVTGLTAPGAAAFSNFCSPWLASQGSGDPSIGNPPGFTGGQCSMVTYNVTTSYNFLGQNPNVTTVPVPGPIVGWYQERGTGPLRPNGFLLGIETVNRGSGTFWEQLPGGNWVRVLDSSSGNQPNIQSGSITGVVRADGQPDDCGNPEAPILPNPNPRPNPVLQPEEEPFSDPGGRPVVPMPPIDNPLGDPIQLPNFPLPGFDGPVYPGDDESDPEGDPGAPGNPVDTEPGGEAEGEAAEGEELVSVKVDIVVIPNGARKVGNLPGRDVYVGAMYLYLGTDDGLELQAEGVYLESGQMFFAERPSTKWKVYAAPGYNLRVTPYYREA